jgi:AraC-like DNA-binding protein
MVKLLEKTMTDNIESPNKAHIAGHFLLAAMQGAIKLGHSQEKLLALAGISKPVFSQTLSLNNVVNQSKLPQITETELTQMVKVVWKLTQDEFMGFTVTPCHTGTFALMAEHCLLATTLGAMLKRSAHFFSVICPQLTTTIEQSDDLKGRIFFTIHIIDAQKDQDHFFQEFLLLMWQRFSCWLVNQHIPFNSTSFSYAKPQHVQHYNEMFPCEHHFKQKYCGFTFHEKYLHLPIVRNQSELTKFLATSPAYILRRPHQDHRLGTQIKHFLAQSDFLEMPSLAQIASEFGMTSRSISRKLKEEGCTFSQIKDAMRLDYAKKLLLTEHLSITKISELVGFSDVVSFSRAFKRWTGKAPTPWRCIH